MKAINHENEITYETIAISCHYPSQISQVFFDVMILTNKAMKVQRSYENV